MTSVSRTLLDLASSSPRRLGWLLERSRRRGLLDLASLDELIRRNRGERGTARLRAGIEEFREPVFSRSKLERRFLSLLRQAGLPLPALNVVVEGYELDAYWSDLRFVVELDTYEHHGDPFTFESDRLRQEDLKLVGIEMTRITGRRIDREPAAVTTRLRRLLLSRRTELELMRR